MVPQQELTYSEGVDNYRLVRCSSTPGQGLMYICIREVGHQIGSGDGLPPARRQAITWSKGGLLSIEFVRTRFSEIQIKYGDFQSR